MYVYMAFRDAEGNWESTGSFGKSADEVRVGSNNTAVIDPICHSARKFVEPGSSIILSATLLLPILSILI